MHLASMVEMIESGFGDRVLLGGPGRRITGTDVADLVGRGAAALAGSCSAVVYAGENHPLLPIALFSPAWAGVPFVPVNYRLEDHHLNALIARRAGAIVLADAATAPRIDAGSVTLLDDWLAGLPAGVVRSDPPFDDDAVAIVLFT